MTWTRENINSATDYQRTQLDWVYANAQFSYEDRAVAYNNNGINEYLNVYKQCVNAVSEHPDLAVKWPTPPFKWIVQQDAGGWPVITQSSELVIQPMIYEPPAKPKQGKWLIGIRYYPGNDTWFYALPGDTTGNMEEDLAVSADGVMGRFQKRMYPGFITGIFMRLGDK